MFIGNFEKNQYVRNIYFLLKTAGNFFKFQPFLMIRQFTWFFSQLKNLNKLGKNKQFKKVEYFPCLFDNLSYTPLDSTYFFQDSWAAKHIFDMKPSHHYDIGSSAKTIGILSQFVPITMIDIRPIQKRLYT